MSAVLTVQDISMRFGGLAALSEVSFEVGEGELTALVGPNGAGKSTLFNIIAGVFPPTAGRIELAGADVTGKSSHALARLGVARTFQLVTLFPDMTVEENVVQGLHRHTRLALFGGIFNTASYRADVARTTERARAVLALLGIEAHRNERAAELPLGIAKLLTVAIALATEPKLLLLDEPAAGLSLEESNRMMDLISGEVKKRCTVLLVEHNMRMVMTLCHDILVMNYGARLAEGDPADVSANADVVAAYLGTEAKHA